MTFDQYDPSDNIAREGDFAQQSVAENLYQSAYEHLMPVRSAQENRNGMGDPADNLNAINKQTEAPKTFDSRQRIYNLPALELY